MDTDHQSVDSSLRDPDENAERQRLLSSRPETNEQPAPKLTWRQVLNLEFKRMWSDQSDIAELEERHIIRNRKIIQHALSSFVSLVIPLTATFILVLLFMCNLPFFRDKQYVFVYYSPIRERETDTPSQKLGSAIINSLIFAAIIIVQTIIIVALYKYEFYKTIYCVLNLSIMLTLVVLSFLILTQILARYNLAMDWVTLSVILLNYSVVGMVAIFTSLSLRIQQIYHITSSAMISAIFARFLQEWTGWVVLFVLVIWDLVAVLAPFGPLKMLVELAQERNQGLFPALIFKTMLEPGDYIPPNEETTQNPPILLQELEPAGTAQVEETNSQRSHESEEEPSFEGSQLGLGDFVFFGILMAKASLYYDINVIFSCYVALIFGFLITYLILIMVGRALPALPVSLIIALIIYFSSAFLTSPFYNYLSTHNLVV